MHIRDILKHRQKELTKVIEVAQEELDQVERALAAIGGNATDTAAVTDRGGMNAVSQSEHAVKRHAMPVNDAIVIAIEAGKKTPMDILHYLRDELDLRTTINSVRSRVSPLKKKGRIAHDGAGWVPVQKFGGSAPKGESEGAPTPSPSFNLEPTA